MQLFSNISKRKGLFRVLMVNILDIGMFDTVQIHCRLAVLLNPVILDIP